MAATVLANAFASGGRSSRYGDFVIIRLQALSFVATAMEFQQVQTWARSRLSQGAAHRDRMAFVDRFETVLARSGGGIATKGSRKVLAALVKNMKQAGLDLEGWLVPQQLEDDIEIKRKPRPEAVAGADGALLASSPKPG